jgi:hypothetical protein
MAQTKEFVSRQFTNSSAGSPSELSEVQALRQELTETQKKLQGYADAGLDIIVHTR